MKNRHLLSLLRTAFVGLFLLVLASVSFAGNPVDKGTSRNDDPFYRMKANQTTGVISAADVLKAQQQAEQMRTKSSSRLNLNWSPLGPTNIAGPATSAIFDNRDATGSTIYLGAPCGGIWRSTTLGLTWHAIGTPDGNIPRVSCMAQTKSGVFFVGTGQVYKDNYNSGNGLYTSTDGLNFTLVPGTAFNPHWLGIAQLAADPRNERMYVATIGGIYYSDNGTDWITALPGYANDVSVGSDGTVLAVVGDSVYVARGGDISNFILLSTGDSTKLPNVNIGWVRVAVSPSNPQVMYASICQPSGFMRGVYGSQDAGNTWTLIFPASASFEPYGVNGLNYNVIAVVPNNPDEIFIGSKKMWLGKRVAGQEYFDWEVVSDGSISPSDVTFAPNYHNQYSFQPGNSGRMVMATDGGLTVATIRPGQIVYKTSSLNLQIGQFSTLANTYNKNYVMGGAKHNGTIVDGAYYPSLVNEPLNGLQIWKDGNDYGDEGRTGGSCAWSKIYPNLVIFTNTDSNSSTYRTLRRRELTDLTYDNDPLGTDIAATTGQNLPITLAESFNYTNTLDSVKFYNKSETDTIPAGTPITVKSKNDGFPFVYTTTKVILPNDSAMIPDPIAARFFLYTTKGGRKGVFMSKVMLQFDQTPEWFLVYKDVSPLSSGDICTLAVSSDMNTLWMGTTQGRIYRASNLLRAYNYATADYDSPTFIVSNDTLQGIPFKGRYITGISVDPNNPNHVMVTLGNYGNTSYVYMTQNALDQVPVWKDVTGSLPSNPVLSGIIEMHNQNNAILGTEWGIFTTSNLLDTSPTWEPDMANMGNVPVTALSQQTIQAYPMLNYGAVYAATWGLGFFRDTTYLTPVGVAPGPSGKNLKNDLKISPNPIRDYANITYTLGQTTNTEIFVYNLNGTLVMGGNLGIRPQGESTSRIDFTSLPAGMYIIRINNSLGKVVKQ
ncbi:MAG: T9SS type A sorting domain-containing protein [Bacteroidetes bacterium]|nr:T9SS type A sorting domain-containing protein [Bacteroidota bacterium]